MKRILVMAVLAGTLSLALVPDCAQAMRRKPVAATKTYQVTGPVLEVTNDMIVVQKGKERWEVARDASSKITGDLKVGATVTIQYRMTAVAVNVHAPKAPPAKAAPKKP
ncbi:MAG TPA: hypothetical protein VLM38_06380 [Blastocatellia bacterium]|nr:hypothetical protein [Blastocatellia bacterium]